LNSLKAFNALVWFDPVDINRPRAQIQDDGSVCRAIILIAATPIYIDGGIGLGNAIRIVNVAKNMDSWPNSGKTKFQFLTSQVGTTTDLIEDSVWWPMSDENFGADRDFVPDFPNGRPATRKIKGPIEKPGLPW
jgi:hypothetical protein